MSRGLRSQQLPSSLLDPNGDDDETNGNESKEEKSIKNVLLQFEACWKEINTQLRHFDLADTSHKAFYLSNNLLTFRHGGRVFGCPKQVFLETRTKDENKVHVFFSAGGTGKSIELAGSAYSRGADLALVWSNTGEISDAESSSLGERQALALDIMAGICKELRSDILKQMLTELRQVASRENRNLRLVFCLDEMGSLPLFVRAVIADREKFVGKAIATLWPEIRIENVDVLLSIAGTGVSRGSMGSDPENFCILQTSATNDPRRLFETLMGGGF